METTSVHMSASTLGMASSSALEAHIGVPPLGMETLSVISPHNVNHPWLSVRRAELSPLLAGHREARSVLAPWRVATPPLDVDHA